MRRLHYSGSGYVVMADDVCDALMRYAQALAKTQASDMITVPIVLEGGVVENAQFLLGPASQLYSVPVPNAPETAPEAAIVDDLKQRAKLLQTYAPITDGVVEMPILDDFV